MTEPATETKKYFVRFSNAADFDNLMAFYADNAHKNVYERDEKLLRQLAENGSVTLIEAEDGKIVGATISYLLAKDAGAPSYDWLEIGTTRIVLNGYPGLFDVMIAMQTLRAYLVEPPESRFVCQMDTTPVQQMAGKLGFRPFTPDPAMLAAKEKTFRQDITCNANNWYSAGPEALPVLAQKMLDSIDKPALVNVKNGDTIKLDFSKSKFFSLFEEEFRDLAKRDLGNPDTPDYSNSVAQSRQKWMRWYFK